MIIMLRLLRKMYYGTRYIQICKLQKQICLFLMIMLLGRIRARKAGQQKVLQQACWVKLICIGKIMQMQAHNLKNLLLAR